jgi:hypothetical protein
MCNEGSNLFMAPRGKSWNILLPGVSTYDPVQKWWCRDSSVTREHHSTCTEHNLHVTEVAWLYGRKIFLALQARLHRRTWKRKRCFAETQTQREGKGKAGLRLIKFTNSTLMGCELVIFYQCLSGMPVSSYKTTLSHILEADSPWSQQ